MPHANNPPGQSASSQSFSNELEDSVGTQRLDTLGGATSSSTGEDLSFLAPAQSTSELGRLGHYRIVKKLGKGGMGAVFLAEDTKLQRKVAVKVMLPKFAADAVAKERFLREARAAAAVKHENVVIIYQVDEERGIPFIAMEYLQGMPLDAYQKQHGALPVPHVLRIGREIAAGLASAHDQGLIHRDIKPANIWLEAPKGRVKVLDFGLARPQSDDAHLTGSGTVMGTPAFMSPEQGRAEKIDQRADLFSLGGVLYTLCTGKPPFGTGNMMAVLTALAMSKPQPAHELNPLVPPALSNLIDRLLAKIPEERPPTAKAVIAALRAIERPTANAPQVVYVPLAVPIQEDASPWGNIDQSGMTERATASKVRLASQRTWPLVAFLGALVIIGTITIIAFRGKKPPTAPTNEVVEKKPDPVIKKKPSESKNPAKTAAPKVSPEIELFNGKDLTGWTIGKGAGAKMEMIEGKPALVLEPDTTLNHQGSFSDFHLTMVFQSPAEGTSAVQLAYHIKALNQNGINAQLAPNVWGKFNYWNPAGRAKPGEIRDGKIIPNVNAMPEHSLPWNWTKIKPPGEWNQLDVVTLGDSALHAVNGKIIAVCAELRHGDQVLNSGRIQLASLGRSVIRSLKLRPIAALPEQFGGPK